MNVAPVADAQNMHDDAFVVDVADQSPVTHPILSVIAQTGTGQCLPDAARIVERRDLGAQRPEQANLDGAVQLL